MRKNGLLDEAYKENVLNIKYVFAEMTRQQKEEMEEMFGN